MTENPRNVHASVLDRAARPPRRLNPSRAVAAPPNGTPREDGARPQQVSTALTREYRLIGGHFAPESRPSSFASLAAEEDTTVQALLEQALDLLLAKKASDRVPASV